MLDLAAFGMAPSLAAEPATHQQAAGGITESGMLDLAAFGMAPPTAAEPAASSSSATMCLAKAAANGGATPATQSRARQLEPPQQPMLAAQQLLPVATECYQQLQAMLVARSSAEGEGENEPAGSASLAAAHGTAPVGSTASLQHLLQTPGPSGPSVAVPIPGLTLAETEEVLAIAGAFAAGAAGGGGPSSPGVDTAAAHFITAVSLACATSRGRQGHSSWQPGQQQGQQRDGVHSQQRVTVMNAAGVAFTLAPSSVVGEDETGGHEEGGCMGQRWGLLRGLDATALLWALLSGGLPCCWPCAAAGLAGAPWLCRSRARAREQMLAHVSLPTAGSFPAPAVACKPQPAPSRPILIFLFFNMGAGTEEGMLQQSLRRLQQLEAASSAAAAAAQSSDQAAFLAVKAAKAEPGACCTGLLFKAPACCALHITFLSLVRSRPVPLQRPIPSPAGSSCGSWERASGCGSRAPLLASPSAWPSSSLRHGGMQTTVRCCTAPWASARCFRWALTMSV